MHKPNSFVYEGLFSILAATVFVLQISRFYFCRETAILGLRPPHFFEVSRSNTVRHTHSVALL